jgi:hypothetical protein
MAWDVECQFTKQEAMAWVRRQFWANHGNLRPWQATVQALPSLDFGVLDGWMDGHDLSRNACAVCMDSVCFLLALRF